MIDLKDPNYRLYLPVLYGAEYPNSAVQEDEPKPAPNKPAALSVNLAAGFSYPGPQPIVSDFPKPTNLIQTLLQPKLLDPPTLPPPLSLPNLVQMPDGEQVRVPGMVVCRQQPGTAKGFVFLLLEDEFGMTNVIVPPWLHEQQRVLVRGEAFVIISGELQRKENTVNLLAKHFDRLPVPRQMRPPESHNFG